jgi:hypothetical protein
VPLIPGTRLLGCSRKRLQRKARKRRLDERYVAAILLGNTLRVHFSHEPGFCASRKIAPFFSDFIGYLLFEDKRPL